MSQMFDFQYDLSHKEAELDPNEQSNLRCRLFARAIRINGLSQVNLLFPYLQTRVEKVFDEKVNPLINTDGISYFRQLRDWTDYPSRLEFHQHQSDNAGLRHGDVGYLFLRREVMYAESLRNARLQLTELSE